MPWYQTLWELFSNFFLSVPDEFPSSRVRCPFAIEQVAESLSFSPVVLQEGVFMVSEVFSLVVGPLGVGLAGVGVGGWEVCREVEVWVMTSTTYLAGVEERVAARDDRLEPRGFMADQ